MDYLNQNNIYYSIHPVAIPFSHHEIYRYCQLTWNRKTHPFQKGKSSSKPSLFHFHASFFGGNFQISIFLPPSGNNHTSLTQQKALLSRWSGKGLVGYGLVDWRFILLMEEMPNNHLGCVKLRKSWDKWINYQPQLVQDFSHQHRRCLFRLDLSRSGRPTPKFAKAWWQILFTSKGCIGPPSQSHLQTLGNMVVLKNFLRDNDG